GSCTTHYRTGTTEQDPGAEVQSGSSQRHGGGPIFNGSTSTTPFHTHSSPPAGRRTDNLISASISHNRRTTEDPFTPQPHQARGPHRLVKPAHPHAADIPPRNPSSGIPGTTTPIPTHRANREKISAVLDLDAQSSTEQAIPDTLTGDSAIDPERSFPKPRQGRSRADTATR